MSIKQDGCVPRTPLDVDRRYKAVPGDVEKIQEQMEGLEVDDTLSTSSTNSVQNKVITEALNTKVSKVAGKDLSSNDFTDEYKDKMDNFVPSTNDFTDEYKQKLDNMNEFTDTEKTKLSNIEANAQVNVLEKVYIAGEELTPTNKAVNIYVDSYTSKYSTNPVQNKAITTYVNEKTEATTYELSSYKVSSLSILRSSCIVKNNRVCINFVGTLSMNANATTTLFNLPAELRPTATKDFVVFGQSNNNDGYVGYGYITSDGLTQVRFSEAISSYIRFSVTYDLD